MCTAEVALGGLVRRAGRGPGHAPRLGLRSPSERTPPAEAADARPPAPPGDPAAGPPAVTRPITLLTADASLRSAARPAHTGGAFALICCPLFTRTAAPAPCGGGAVPRPARRSAHADRHALNRCRHPGLAPAARRIPALGHEDRPARVRRPRPRRAGGGGRRRGGRHGRRVRPPGRARPAALLADRTARPLRRQTQERRPTGRLPDEQERRAQPSPAGQGPGREPGHVRGRRLEAGRSRCRIRGRSTRPSWPRSGSTSTAGFRG